MNPSIGLIDLPDDHPMHLVHRLRHCLESEDDISINGYCDLWEELCRFIKKWGILLKFVTDDVTTKVDAIKSIRGDNEERTRTLKMMVAWEEGENRMRSYHPKSGTVNILILHRAMDFVIHLINDVYNEQNDDSKVSIIARGAYDRTLSKHHPWLVRKVVATALLTLPYKKDFIASMRGPMKPEEDHCFHIEFTKHAKDVQARVANVLNSYQMI